MRLFDLTSEYQHLLALIDDGEDFNAALDELRGDIKVKAENYAKVIKTLESEADAIREEAERLQAKAKHRANAVGRLKAHLLTGLETSGLERVTGTVYTVALQNSPPSVEILDEALVPDLWRKATLTVPVASLPSDLVEQAELSIDKRGVIESWQRSGETCAGLVVRQNKHLRIR